MKTIDEEIDLFNRFLLSADNPVCFNLTFFTSIFKLLFSCRNILSLLHLVLTRSLMDYHMHKFSIFFGTTIVKG